MSKYDRRARHAVEPIEKAERAAEYLFSVLGLDRLGWSVTVYEENDRNSAARSSASWEYMDHRIAIDSDKCADVRDLALFLRHEVAHVYGASYFAFWDLLRASADEEDKVFKVLNRAWEHAAERLVVMVLATWERDERLSTDRIIAIMEGAGQEPHNALSARIRGEDLKVVLQATDGQNP